MEHRRLRPIAAGARRGFTFDGAPADVARPTWRRAAAPATGFPPGPSARLAALLGLVAAEPAAITSVRDPAEGVDAHVADSLVALDAAGGAHGARLADLGSGGGFPGLALAIALPAAHVALVESVGRKCAFLAGAVERARTRQREVVNARAEAWPEGSAPRRRRRPGRWRRCRSSSSTRRRCSSGRRARGLEGPPRAGRGGRRRRRGRGAGDERARGDRRRCRSAAARDRHSTSLEGEPTPAVTRAGREWPANGRSEPRVEGDGASAPNEEGAGSDRSRR